MGIFDALKALFGLPKHNQSHASDKPNASSPNYFIKPDWANEDEDSDDDLVRRNPRSSFTFNVFTSPLEMHQYFEQQMSELAKQFEEAFSSQSIFNGNAILDSFFGEGRFTQPGHPAILPPTYGDHNNSLRDKCLKPDARKQIKESTIDSDLDKEFKNGNLNLFKSKESAPNIQIYSPSNTPQGFATQVFTRVVRRPDGSTEEIRTKQVGDQKYTKITRTDSQGQTSVHEDIVNIDEDKLKDFQSVGEASLPKLDLKDWFRFRL